MEKITLKYQGQSEQEMIDSCEEWFQETVKDFFFTAAIAKVKEHQEKGHKVALLTASKTPISLDSPSKAFPSPSTLYPGKPEDSAFC